MTAGVRKSHGLRAAGAARKGGTPGEGSPFNPFLRFVSIGAFRALRRAAKGSAPGPRPLFCKKAGQKTFTGPDFRQPKPLAPGASDPIRPRSGHLSGRVAAPTRVGEAGGSRNLTGSPPPQKAFFFGAPPRFFGQDQRNGVESQHNVKITANKTASSFNPPPRESSDFSPSDAAAQQRAGRGRKFLLPPISHPRPENAGQHW